MSAYEIAVSEGFSGDVTEWLASLSGASLTGTATVTLTNAFSVTQTVSAPGVTATDTVFGSLAAHDDTDENDPELLDLVALSLRPGTDQLTVTLTFSQVTNGPVKINWGAF